MDSVCLLFKGMGWFGTQQDCPVPLNHPVFFVSLNEAGSSVIDMDDLRMAVTLLNGAGQKSDWFSIVKD